MTVNMGTIDVVLGRYFKDALTEQHYQMERWLSRGLWSPYSSHEPLTRTRRMNWWRPWWPYRTANRTRRATGAMRLRINNAIASLRGETWECDC